MPYAFIQLLDAPHRQSMPWNIVALMREPYAKAFRRCVRPSPMQNRESSNKLHKKLVSRWEYTAFHMSHELHLMNNIRMSHELHLMNKICIMNCNEWSWYCDMKTNMLMPSWSCVLYFPNQALPLKGSYLLLSNRFGSSGRPVPPEPSERFPQTVWDPPRMPTQVFRRLLQPRQKDFGGSCGKKHICFKYVKNAC
jgi:hypothetical protein